MEGINGGYSGDKTYISNEGRLRHRFLAGELSPSELIDELSFNGSITALDRKCGLLRIRLLEDEDVAKNLLGTEFENDYYLCLSRCYFAAALKNDDPPVLESLYKALDLAEKVDRNSQWCQKIKFIIGIYAGSS